MPLKQLIITLIAISTLLISCNQNGVYEHFVNIPEGIWDKGIVPHFTTTIEETIPAATIYLKIRHSDAYPYSNLKLKITTTLPNGGKNTEPFEVNIKNKDNKFVGSGMGDLWDLKIPLKQHTKLEAGTYNFDINQTMADDFLPFIVDIGIKIEKE